MELKYTKMKRPKSRFWIHSPCERGKKSLASIKSWKCSARWKFHSDGERIFRHSCKLSEYVRLTCALIGADGIFLFPATLQGRVCVCYIYDKSVKVKRIGTLFTASDALQSRCGFFSLCLSLFISLCICATVQKATSLITNRFSLFASVVSKRHAEPLI